MAKRKSIPKTVTGCPCCHKPARLSGRDETSERYVTSMYVCDTPDCAVLSFDVTTETTS